MKERKALLFVEEQQKTSLSCVRIPKTFYLLWCNYRDHEKEQIVFAIINNNEHLISTII